MVPTIVDGEYVLIDKLTPRFDDYHYGDVVVFQPPSGSGLEREGIPFIKRIIGMPGDTVSLENGRVFVTRAGRQPGAASRSRTSSGAGRVDGADHLPARRLPADVDRRRRPSTS